MTVIDKCKVRLNCKKLDMNIWRTEKELCIVIENTDFHSKF